MGVKCIVAVLAFAGLAGSAGATVVGGAVTGGYSATNGGTFQILGTNPGFDVGDNNFNDLNLYAFNEDQNISISSTIAVDIGTSPVNGDVVASHYVFYDPAGTLARRQLGYVDFDADIYGIATSNATLEASDFLANNLVNYLSPTNRGLEGGQDSVSIGLDGNGSLRRLYVDWAAGTPGDYVRVFTKESPLAAVPIPAGGVLLLSALAALGLRRKH